ncbi:MAG TPA: DinB family protein [Planctomycetes bacterium]|nr:DinB family protein [Planctomycetota bacterium]
MLSHMLTYQFRLNATTLAMNLKDMTDEHARVLPPHGGNNALWILGHVVHTRRALMGLLGLDTSAMNDVPLDRFARYTERLAEEEAPVELATLVRLFDDSQSVIESTIQGMNDQGFDQPLPEPGPLGAKTVGELASALQFHEAYHIGQIGLLRRIAGLPPAIT